jgi:hypothetical protein
LLGLLRKAGFARAASAQGSSVGTCPLSANSSAVPPRNAIVSFDAVIGSSASCRAPWSNYSDTAGALATHTVARDNVITATLWA